jgi:PhnB protein
VSDPVESSLAPRLTVGDASRAVVFDREALGAKEVYRLEDADGAVDVARLRVGASEFWVQGEPDMDARRDEHFVRMILTVDDPDAAFERAVSAGADPVTSVHQEFGWRTAA